jgi:protein-tyrosine phosphatase
MNTIKVLFVCLGNICRSPLAEGIFRHKVSEKGLENSFLIDSAGTANYHVNELPDSRSIAVAAQHGIALRHRVRQLVAKDFTDFDYILVMDDANLSNAKKLSQKVAQPSAKLLKMREFDDSKSASDVEDPYYGTAVAFQQCYEILNQSTENFLAELLNHPKS